MGALVRSLRLRQWIKNLLLFAGVLFSQRLGEPEMALRALAGFIGFGFLASAGYLINDLRDVAADRQHPVKRLRPIASGALSAAAVVAAATPLVGAGLAIALWLGPGFLSVAVSYTLLNLLYSVVLKRQVLLDVFAISVGFVLRAMAGVELLRPVAPDTQLSPWLLVCTFFGALFLGFAKRRRELANAGEQASRQRPVLDRYSPELLDGLLAVTASASLIAYALYTIWPGTVAKFGTEALLYTVPFVAYGIFRYLYLVRATEQGEDPSLVLIRDAPLAVCVGLYLVTVLVILYGS